MNPELLLELLREAGISVGPRIHPELEEEAVRAPPEPSSEAEFAEKVLRSAGIDAVVKAVTLGGRGVLVATLRADGLDFGRMIFYSV